MSTLGASNKKKIAILGASGSIGTQALDVYEKHKDKLELVALSVHTSVNALLTAAHKYKVKHLLVSDETLKDDPRLDSLPSDVSLYFGRSALSELGSLSGADIVLNALVGSVGLQTSYETLKNNKVLALANKESLVVGGELLMPLVQERAQLMPVDSEHSAIFQCFEGESRADLYKIWLTASGGPFFGKSLAELENVSVRDALSHPNWSMGKKISIDSATLMNKGLEVIEAKHLFDVDFDQIEVLIQRQSAIHSMVEFVDGSIKAHLGATDMRIPIQYAFSYPNRWDSPLERISFADIARMDFYYPDVDTFKCLSLALEAGKTGKSAPCMLNAANEVAVKHFLEGTIGFNDIYRTVEHMLEQHTLTKLTNIDDLCELDYECKQKTEEYIVTTFR